MDRYQLSCIGLVEVLLRDFVAHGVGGIILGCTELAGLLTTCKMCVPVVVESNAALAGPGRFTVSACFQLMLNNCTRLRCLSRNKALKLQSQSRKRLVILYQMPESWLNVLSVWEAAQADPTWDVRVIVLPFLHKEHDWKPELSKNHLDGFGSCTPILESFRPAGGIWVNLSFYIAL
ncbi:hypothetical protein [Castellaniella sp.]|uniref:hypothetical protein n=1 Tax=Castellaniella sp. TaxID=1955812 RepID=UPI002AFE28C5|nr:hypothetical protein [Castellaniella sp.]